MISVNLKKDLVDTAAQHITPIVQEFGLDNNGTRAVIRAFQAGITFAKELLDEQEWKIEADV